MSEESLRIAVDDEIILEARLVAGTLPKIAVICHPHPLYGGNMDNNVVLAIREVFRDEGWGAVRFNFRGVGQSSGEYADGIGEQADLQAVCRFLWEQPTKPEVLCVVGYSFGAWVALSAVDAGLALDRLILISPPMDFMAFDQLGMPSALGLITLGERDDFCRVASLQAWLKKHGKAATQTRVATFPGVDHFYWGKEGLLQETIRRFLRGAEPQSSQD